MSPVHIREIALSKISLLIRYYMMKKASLGLPLTLLLKHKFSELPTLRPNTLCLAKTCFFEYAVR